MPNSKLIFLDGYEFTDMPIKDQLTEDALAVIQLLAIDPEDIVQR